jgi:hypothetical protein
LLIASVVLYMRIFPPYPYAGGVARFRGTPTVGGKEEVF